MVAPSLDQVVARDVRLVAHADELADAEPQLLRVIESRKTRATRLRREGNRAARRIHRAEGRVETNVGRGAQHAETVGSDEAHAHTAAILRELSLLCARVASTLSEAGADHHDAFDALGGAGFGDLADRSRRGRDHRQIDWAGNVAHAAVRFDGLNPRGVRIDRVDRAAKPGAEQVVEDLRADAAALT